MDLRGKRIFVGLSGGVDSSVTAALLQKAGAEVIGVFIKGWYPPGMPCTWADDRRDAMRVAAHLDIPFYTLDAHEEYKRGVIDYLLSEYKAGRTPNPDIMCNREVKFGAFFRFAQEHQADYIATGHYAQAIRTDGQNVQLVRGIDAGKDQSYFLWAIPKEALAKTLFPLGNKQKSEVRKLAKQFKLPVAEKKDSQGICFLGSISVEDFLKNEFHPKPGDITDENGRTLGTHNGAILHTLGERISVQGASAGPWYVVKKYMQSNVLVVAHEVSRVPHTTSLTLRDANWFADSNGSCEVQYRYHGPKILGTLEGNTFTPTELFKEPIASGQSLVVYHQNVCIGGGIIA